MEPNQLEYVDTVVECSEGLLSLVNDILDLSRAAANKIELDEGPFDLHSMLRTSFAVYKTAEARLRMVLDIDNTVPNWVIGDSKRLRQVLINLISNSVKFTEFGGIECRVRCEPSGPPPPRSVTPEAPSSPPRAGSGGFGIPMDGDIPEELAGWLRLSIDVQDTGIGIPAEYIPKLFQPFQQIDSSMSRKYQGTGLGLAICRKIVELMHGQIGVRSDGNGSTFSFTVFVRACPPDLEGGQKSLERKKKAILSNRVRREREIMAMGGAPWDEVRALGRGLSGSLSNHSSDDSSGRRGAYLGYPPRTGPSSNYSSLPRGNSGPLPSSYRSASPVPSPDERILSLDRSLDRYKRHDEDEDGELLEGEVPVFSVPAEALAIMDSFEPIKKQEHVDEDSVLGSAAEPGASSNPSREAIREGVVANGLFSSTPSADALEPGHVHVDRSASGTSATSLGRESSSGMVVEPHEDYSQLSVLIAEDNKVGRRAVPRSFKYGLTFVIIHRLIATCSFACLPSSACQKPTSPWLATGNKHTTRCLPVNLPLTWFLWTFLCRYFPGSNRPV